MRMENMKTRLAIVANAAIVIVCILASVMLIVKLKASRAASGVKAGISTGDTLPSAWQLRLDTKASSVVAIVRNTCGNCTASMDFYRELNVLQIPFIVVSDESVDATAEYLRQHQVTAAQIVSIASNELNIRGTPTLFIVDPRGKVHAKGTGLITGAARRRFVAFAGRASM